MIVVGLNGGSGELIRRGIEAGLLPALERIQREGAGGDVWNLTTSSPAEWSAHLTGVSPREGGVHGYLSRRRIYLGIGRARTEDLRVKTYPELLDEAGIGVGLVNLPPTFPPLELEHGFSVSGMLTPVGESDYTRPSDLADDLGDYEIGVLYEEVRYSDFGEPMYGLVREGQDLALERLREDVLRVERRRLQAARTLLEGRNPDLMVLLVSDLEALQRFTWHEREEKPLEETAAMRLYQSVDDFLGDCMEAEPQRDLLVCSGHGFKAQGTPEASSSERSLWSTLRGTVGPWVPEGFKQTGAYAALYDVLEGWVGGRSSRASPPEDRPEQAVPPGLVQTGFPNRRGFWALRSEDLSEDLRRDLRFLDLSALVMHRMGRPVPAAYEGAVPGELYGSRGEPVVEEENLEVDRGEPPRPNQELQERIMEEL